MEKREPTVKLKDWPTEDWYYTHPLYRFIKANFETPIKLAARVRSKGTENVPLEGGVILASNHFTWADPVLLGVPLPRPAFYLAKEKLFENPVMRTFLEGMGQVKVDRVRGGNNAAIQKTLELLEAGCVVGVFPEGTRSRYGELKRGRTGVARMALLSGCPVVPVAMTTADFWPKGASLPRVGRKVYINFGKPMQWTEKADAANDRQLVRDVTDDIMDEVARLLGEAYTARETGEKWD